MTNLSYLPEPLRNPNNCQKALIPGWNYSYGYKPSLAAGIIFTILFGIAFVGHTVQAVRIRRWTSILLAIGALTELIGWAGRTWSSECPYNQNAYLMQITTLIIAPCFFTAALYVLLGQFIRLIGPHSSILSAKMYAIVFVTSDIISLVIQAVGGALASEASGQRKSAAPGSHTMLAGIVFQLFTMTVFSVLALDTARRASRSPTPNNYNLVMPAMFVSLMAIYARSVYRSVELGEGWTGYLMTHEKYFIALDGSLMVLAVGILLVFDPARLITEVRKPVKGGSEEWSS